VKGGERVVRERFGVDEDVCTGDHACIRLSGCPSLSVKHTNDPLKRRSGRGDRQQLRRMRHCGEVAERAVLCPSFYRADIIHTRQVSTACWRSCAVRHRFPAAAPRPAASRIGLRAGFDDIMLAAPRHRSD